MKNRKSPESNIQILHTQSDHKSYNYTTTRFVQCDQHFTYSLCLLSSMAADNSVQYDSV